MACYFSQTEAVVAANNLHQLLVSEWETIYTFELRPDFVLHEWYKANQILYIDQYDYLHELQNELKAEGNYELLGKLWRDSVGEFAFVQEEVVHESQYLKV